MAVVPTDQIIKKQRRLAQLMKVDKPKVTGLFWILCIHSNWLQKGYINSTEIHVTNNEHDAIEFIDNWNKLGKGYARFITPNN